MDLGAPHDDTVFLLLHDPKIKVFIGLFAGIEAAIPFHVGYAGIGRKIVLLHILQKFEEAAIIRRGHLFVDVEGHDGKSAQAVEPRAPLVAGSHIIAQEAVDLHPGYEIFDGLGGQGETVDSLTGKRRSRRQQVPVLLGIGKLVGRPRGIDPAADSWMIHHVLDFLPEHVSGGL